jgi:dihydrofolate reductase
MNDELLASDALLLGRTTWQEFEKAWPAPRVGPLFDSQ